MTYHLQALYHVYLVSYRILGPFLLVLISVLGARNALYWRSFLLHWKRYRGRRHITTLDLARIRTQLPYLKVQTTTRGTDGTTEVVMRGFHNILALVEEMPSLYAPRITCELMTESRKQAEEIEAAFAGSPLHVSSLVLPKDYETGAGTKFKARALHYMTEHRRRGWNRKPGKTFIVHFDEESVMEPKELRKLWWFLAHTDKKIMEGPIYYPLEYMDTSPLCRAMEANRPVGCFECRHVMESGLPLHLHGSNLVVEEEFENDLGWDIGMIDDKRVGLQPFVAEDYMFGMSAYVKAGADAFGWHGAVVIEQPPFSFKSAFKQRYRWIFGVLQGVHKWTHHPSFKNVSLWNRIRLVYGTRFRVACFGSGVLIGGLAAIYLPYMLYRAYSTVVDHRRSIFPWPVDLWVSLVGLMWFGSIIIGAWYNLEEDTFLRRWTQILVCCAIAPLAGLLESTAGFWAIVQWNLGHRSIIWNPTPKSREADGLVDWSKVQSSGDDDEPAEVSA